jgi:DNA polymerase III alpha subunit
VSLRFAANDDVPRTSVSRCASIRRASCGRIFRAVVSVTRLDAMNAHEGKWVTTAGLVLVGRSLDRQGRHVHIEEETGVANLVIWPSPYKRQRRIILAVSTA